MIRVEATLRDNRNKVTINSNEGKTENSKGDFIKTETIRMTKEAVRLNESSKSKKNVGIGMTMITRTDITPKAMKNSLDLFKTDKKPFSFISKYPVAITFIEWFNYTENVKKTDIFPNNTVKSKLDAKNGFKAKHSNKLKESL